MASAGTAYVRVIGDLSHLNKQLVANFAPQRMKKFGLLAGAALGAGLAGKGLFDLGKTFDEQFDKIRVGTGATGKSLKGLETDFKDVAKSVPDDFGEVGTAITELNQRLGLTGKPLRAFSTQMVQLSRITKTDLSENIASVARAFEDWEVPVKSQTKALDGLFRLGQKSGASVQQLATNVQKFGSPLRILGFTLGEAAATFATFERAGVNIQTTVPGLKLAISNLTKPTADLEKSMKKLGISAASPEEGLKRVFKLLGRDSDLSNIQKRTLAMEIFGKRAGADMAEAIRQGRFEVEDMLKTFGKGDTISKATEDTEDFNEAWQKLKNRVFVAIEPVATKFFKGISDGMEGLAEIDVSEIKVSIGKITTDAGLDKLDLGLGKIDLGLGDAFAGTGADLDKIKNGLTAFSQAMAAAFGPGIKDLVLGFSQAFKGAFQVLAGSIKVIAGLLTGDFGKAWDGVKQIFKGGINAAVGFVRVAFSPLTGAVKALGGAISKPFGAAWDKTKAIFRGGVSGSIGVVRGMGGKLGEIGTSAGRAISRPLKSAWDGIKDTTSGAVGAVIRSVRRMGGAFGDVGGRLRGIAAGPFKAIKDAIKAIIEVLGKVASAARDAVKWIGKIKAPKISVPNPFDLIPGRKRGGIVKERLTIVGEEGPELVTLPVGSRVHPHAQSMRMMKRMQGSDDESTSQRTVVRKPQSMRKLVERVWKLASKTYLRDQLPPQLIPVEKRVEVAKPNAIVGEEGPELVTLPVGSQVFSHPESVNLAQQIELPGYARGGQQRLFKPRRGAKVFRHREPSRKEKRRGDRIAEGQERQRQSIAPTPRLFKPRQQAEVFEHHEPSPAEKRKGDRIAGRQEKRRAQRRKVRRRDRREDELRLRIGLGGVTPFGRKHGESEFEAAKRSERQKKGRFFGLIPEKSPLGAALETLSIAGGLGTVQGPGSKALKEFVGPVGYKRIQGHLRGTLDSDVDRWGNLQRRGTRKEAKKLGAQVQSIDALFQQAKPLDKPATVWRGIPDGLGDQLKRGSAIRDPGYASTSKGRQFAEFFADESGDLLKIQVPAGAKALDMDNLVAAEKWREREKEMLLPRGVRMVVTKVEKRGKGRLIHVKASGGDSRAPKRRAQKLAKGGLVRAIQPRFMEDVFDLPGKAFQRIAKSVSKRRGTQLSLVGEQGPELARLLGASTVVGRKGPEVLELPIGTRIIPNVELPDVVTPSAEGFTPSLLSLAPVAQAFQRGGVAKKRDDDRDPTAKRGQPEAEAKKPRSGKVPYDAKGTGVSGGPASRATKLDRLHLPYKWGGGHGDIGQALKSGFDCSGAVSYALGIPARVSGAFSNWGKSGPGEVSTYSNPKHMVMSIGNRLFGTGDGTGPHWLTGGPEARFSSSFTTRHIGKAGERGSFGKPGEKGEKEKPRRITGGKLSLGQMYSLAKLVEFPDPALAAAVGFAESKGQVRAVGDGGDSIGLWQVNLPAHPQYKREELFDAKKNAQAALSISKGGKTFQPWTMFRNEGYKDFITHKGAPLPKGTRKTITGNSKLDYLSAQLLDAEGLTPADPKDDIRWINRLLRYWRGVYKRNKAAGNSKRQGEARSEITSLAAKKKELRAGTEDPDLYKLGDLTHIGSGPNAFNLEGMTRILDGIELEKANASLTVPPIGDDSIGALAASMQDDIAAATKGKDLWAGIKTLTDGFMQPPTAPGHWEGQGPTAKWIADKPASFTPSKAQSKALAKTKTQAERIGLLQKFEAEAQPQGTWIQGTMKQKIEATQNLGTALDELRNLKAEISKTEDVEEKEPGRSAQEDIKSFMAQISSLFKDFGPNFRPLQSFGDGGIIQGPKGRKVVIEGHGGEAVVNEDGDLTVTIKPEQLKELARGQVINHNTFNTEYKHSPVDPHIDAKNREREIRALV